MTLTPIAQRLAVELSLPVLRLGSVAAGIEQDESYRTTTVVTEDLGFSGLLRKRTKKIIFRALEISVCWKRHFVAF